MRTPWGFGGRVVRSAVGGALVVANGGVLTVLGVLTNATTKAGYLTGMGVLTNAAADCWHSTRYELNAGASFGVSVRLQMKVLLVEDEKKISDFVVKGLKELGFVVECAADGDDGYLHASTQSYDVAVLDIMLPGRDGLSILKSLRAAGNTVPVILVTARGELNERLEGLNLGADDYLVKPFFLDELVARIQAVHRRSTGVQLNLMQAEDLVINLSTREVTRSGESIELTTREFNLLEYLMRSPGRVITRTQILEHVWGYDFDPNTNVVDVCIQRLRRKIDHGRASGLIETVRGAGYRLRKS